MTRSVDVAQGTLLRQSHLVITSCGCGTVNPDVEVALGTLPPHPMGQKFAATDVKVV